MEVFIDIYVPSLIRQIQPTKANLKLLHKLIIEFICRNSLSANRTGFVIVGFGDRERCPSLERFELDGILGGELKFVEGAPVDIGRRTKQADVLGFAQSEMIERFLHGIDAEMNKYVNSLIRQSIKQTADEIASALMPGAAATVSSAIQPIIDKIQNDQIDNLKKHKEDEYSSPIVDMIRHMPKQEMALLARSLIDLTSLKRKVSREQESVGGEVDVAAISKAEGFVWVSRKHYFPAELNSRFFARHYKGIGG